MAAAAPVLWPFAGTDALLNVSLGVCMLALLLLLPLGWVVIRRRLGLRAAGPLWPLLFFELIAIFYAFMTPPWLMPDEPQHMLHAEIVRQVGASAPQQLAAGRFPKSQRDAEQSLATYRSILRSAQRSDMGRWLPDAQPDLTHERLPGVSELNHPPLYYVVAAGLTSPFDGASVLGRLALLRVLGVALTGWAIWLCGASARMLWPTRRRLSEAPLVLAAGIPTVAAFAGAVNNDVMANLVGALLLVLMVAAVTGWMARRPWLWTAGFVTALLAAVSTKRTLLPLLLVLPLAFLLRRRVSLRRMLAVVVAGQIALGCVILGLPARSLAGWDVGGASRPERCAGGVVGQWAFCVPRASEGGLTQYTSLLAFDELANRPATLGAWVRGRPGTELQVDIGDGTSAERHAVPLEAEWQFRTVQFVRPRAGKQLAVTFMGTGLGPLELDGIVLAAGRHSASAPADDGGRNVVWDGKVVSNRLANGSAENAVRRAPGWLPRSVREGVNSGIDQAARAVELWPDTAKSLDVVWGRVVETFGMFWATAGWEVPPLLLPVGLLVLLGVLVAFGWLGALVHLVRPAHGERTPATRRVLAALALCAGAACAALIGRGLPVDREMVVSGRYLFPTLAAVAVVLVAGWRRLWPGDDHSFRNAVRWLALSTHAVFIVVLFFPFLAR
jgi:hypothetical protein